MPLTVLVLHSHTPVDPSMSFMEQYPLLEQMGVLYMSFDETRPVMSPQLERGKAHAYIEAVQDESHTEICSSSKHAAFGLYRLM